MFNCTDSNFVGKTGSSSVRQRPFAIYNPFFDMSSNTLVECGTAHGFEALSCQSVDGGWTRLN